MEFKVLKEFLDEKVGKYNHLDFIQTDPIQIPHLFNDSRNREIAGFFAATIAWGQRITIIKNMYQLLNLMDNTPYEFILNYTANDLERFKYFKHRTFNGEDCVFFIQSLRNIYLRHGGLGKLFQNLYLQHKNMFDVLSYFRNLFFEISHPERTQKHIANVLKGASAKRLNMYLRWFVRKDNHGVDFGLWDKIPMSSLYIPLDIHTGNVARKLGLLNRKQNDWKAVQDLTENLRKFDPDDPIKYDFALFGLGVFEKF
ncbi:MAG TPA: TIGR02757 family protein [Bacteroidales bacterium]|nr:TIGR02757 family protein [Bacteroidales bacterium]